MTTWKLIFWWCRDGGSSENKLNTGLIKIQFKNYVFFSHADRQHILKEKQGYWKHFMAS